MGRRSFLVNCHAVGGLGHGRRFQLVPLVFPIRPAAGA
ncbi:hypothetical protein RCH17_003820 [Arthrobacter sp. MP_M7]|nr:hypothetical protein [Arthrobacter sp. MP_M4]MEC5204988.1 hypothetical protein [Arthrobacter sp. MP_M7]